MRSPKAASPASLNLSSLSDCMQEEMPPHKPGALRPQRAGNEVKAEQKQHCCTPTLEFTFILQMEDHHLYTRLIVPRGPQKSLHELSTTLPMKTVAMQQTLANLVFRTVLGHTFYLRSHSSTETLEL
ncbi:hypothetical protein E2320_010213 [Naja naja]|nr:hypothetical protein E2320_010213 [Naja naja]